MADRLSAIAIAAAGAYAMSSAFVATPGAHQPVEMTRLRGAQQTSSSTGLSSTALSLAGAGTVAAAVSLSQRKRTALRAEFAGGLAGSKFAGFGGSYEFDPCGFSTNYPALVPWFREAELKHGRVAMLAFLGLIGPDVGRFPFDACQDSSVDVLNAHNKLIGPGLGEGQMWVMMVVVGAIESVRFKQLGLNFEGLTLESAGDFGIKLFAPGTEEGMESMKTRELKNGRLAMLAVGGCLTQAAAFDIHHFPFTR
mmetsp:Transcript_7425/g.12914  ORF Transcript_7425/g.12914 Transcript_7425/m.12914 type:complete len:253 (+) Transcript_7425:79-837(+)